MISDKLTVEFRIYENQSLLEQGILTLTEAVRKAKHHHLRCPDRYHEIYRVLEDGRTWGVGQWKPGDDLKGVPGGTNWGVVITPVSRETYNRERFMLYSRSRKGRGKYISLINRFIKSGEKLSKVVVIGDDCNIDYIYQAIHHTIVRSVDFMKRVSVSHINKEIYLESKEGKLC